MAVTQNYWDWKKFTWLADTNTIWSEWQYDNASYNIDTQTEPNWVKLTPQPKEYHTTTNTPTVILDLSDYWLTWILTCTADWKVYKNWALIYTLSSWNEIYDAIWQYNSIGTFYVLLFTASAIHRMELTDPVWVDENWKTFISNGYKKYPVNVYWEIYFASKNKWYKLDTAWTLSSLYTFPAQDKVVWITFFQDNFSIYTTWWNHWRQYLFPILATTPYYNIEWKWLPILWVTNLWWLDYVVTWYNEFYSDLYLVSWTQRKPLKINSEWNNSRGFYWIISSRLDDIYLTWKFDVNTTATQYRLYKFWNYYNGFSQELTPFLWELTDNITCITPSRSVIYIGTNWNKVYSIDLNQAPPKYNTVWEITSMIMDFWMPDTKKSLQWFEISYSNKDTNISNRWWTLTLYARKDEMSSWIEIKTIWSKSDIGKIRVDATEVRNLNFWDFYQIQFKVKLEWSWLSTPFLKKVRVIYQNNLEQ